MTMNIGNVGIHMITNVSIGVTRSFPRDYKIYPRPTPKLHRSAADLCNLVVGGG